MSGWGWAPALIFAIGVLLVAFGVAAWVADLIAKYRALTRSVMATSMPRDELLARRRRKDGLYKECQRRAETMKFSRKL